MRPLAAQPIDEARPSTTGRFIPTPGMLQMYECDPGRPGFLHDFETREGTIHGLVSTLCGAFWFALEQAAATILQQHVYSVFG